ncbi:zinc finger protein 248-like [Sitodiplosis mosellana]|uniref:zinc finger protein 248-like n=1 Tax=Sitodiplosis mosellana TaxID=263140 RepID=UPI002443E7DA|nr:zinc finger protein 248-like [Sitodiplosis mosellana]
MDMDPGEGTSDGRVRRKPGSVAADIKQEPDIKEEPLDEPEFNLGTRPNERFAAEAVEANIKLGFESESDFDLDFDLNGVKDEVECDKGREEKEKGSPADPIHDEGEANAHDGQADEPMVKSNVKPQSPESSGEGKKRDGSRKQNKGNIPRNKAAKKRKEHKCHVCDYIASHKSNLTAHIRTHTGERPYKCDICLKRFPQKSALNLHQKIHSGEKRFECFICLKSFAVKCTLNRHLRTHTDDLPHSCLK